MSDLPPSLKRPRKDYSGFIDFVDLRNTHETFDVTESLDVKESGDDNVWYGRKIGGREHEVVYRKPDGRPILVYVIPPGHENDAGPHPVDRELTLVQFARWLRLNELPLPPGLEPASLNDDDERRCGQARLDRDWVPPPVIPSDVSSSAGSDPQSEAPTEPHAASESLQDSSRSSTADKSCDVKYHGHLEDHAIALLLHHPDWTNRRIADQLNCHPKSLSRFKRFRQARRMAESAREDLPRGRKDAETGNIEAWE